MLIKNLYIIIVSFNSKRWIKNCLESTTPNKVIVVDNNSNDDTLPFILKNYPEVIVLPQDQNLGFGKANNIGIRYALDQGAKFVFLLNHDAYLAKGAIERIHSVHRKNKKYGILSPIHLNGSGEELDRDFHHYVSYKFNKNFFSDYVLKKEEQEIYDVPFINAAGWSISKECLESVGGFDPIFFHYGEDDNFCQRVLFHELKIGIVSGAYLKHDREESLSSVHFLRDDSQLRLIRQWKIYFGNINKEIDKELDTFLKNKKKSWLRTALKFHSAAKKYKKEYRLLHQLKPEIKRSRDINKTKGRHYINKSL